VSLAIGGWEGEEDRRMRRRRRMRGRGRVRGKRRMLFAALVPCRRGATWH
jgi:hypothetical protein